MQTYNVKLESPVSTSYRCQRAADSLDIDVKKKAIHEFSIQVDLKSHFDLGLIVGSSGSGKTTLTKQIFGENCFNVQLDLDKPVIEQFPSELSYDECAELLMGIGLTSVPCWIRPLKTLSNGQKARAEAALAMIQNEFVTIDEWTSVVDRTVAKAMSHCVQKFARKNKKKIVLVSCHYDVIEWLDPDWIIDCNKQQSIDRRLLQPHERKKTEQLTFDVRKIDRKSWKYFSKYRYLSSNLPAGQIYTFGLFSGSEQIGFQCFANYVPTRKGKIPIFHSNRTVIHPDYAGLGLGLKLVNAAANCLQNELKGKVRIMAKFSSIPMYKARLKDPKWKLLETKRQIGKLNVGGSMMRKSGFRENIKTFSFEYIAKPENKSKAVP